MKKLKKFRFQWVLYCSIASSFGILTIYFWPFVSGFSVLMVQSILLTTYLGDKAWFWLLNPVLFGLSFILYKYDDILGLCGNITALEIVFFITIGRFSYFSWSIISGAPIAIFVGLIYLGDNFFTDSIVIGGGVLIPWIIWFGQAYLLSEFLVRIPKSISKVNNDIIDEA